MLSLDQRQRQHGSSAHKRKHRSRASACTSASKALAPAKQNSDPAPAAPAKRKRRSEKLQQNPYSLQLSQKIWSEPYRPTITISVSLNQHLFNSIPPPTSRQKLAERAETYRIRPSYALEPAPLRLQLPALPAFGSGSCSSRRSSRAETPKTDKASRSS